ncbi:hypothetical protein K435DRAFT_573640, partial [Dendrothele bispora CBS 962.96]
FHLNGKLWVEDTPIFANPTLLEPAPLLQSLSILCSWKDITGGVLPQMFSGVTPKLSHLFLEHFTSWPSNHFRNLTHLCLFNQDLDTLPTTSIFLDFLEDSPTLEELAL